MNRLSLRSHLNLSISFALLLLIIPATAGAVSLRAFSASYSLFSGGMHVANTKLSLEQTGDSWRLRLSTKARGIYAMFTKKQPVSETTFNLHEKGVRLRQIVTSDLGDEKKYELATFDWESGQLEVQRKGKQKQLPISEDVYDFQSIHLLAAAMRQQQLKSMTVDFYKRGKLVKSRFVYGGKGMVNIDGKKIESNIYEQVITRSNSKLKYYYDAENPMLPLRIETLESGKNSTVMVIQSVDWSL